MLIYTLSKAVTVLKCEVKGKVKDAQDILEDDRVRINFFRNLKFKMFFISMIADCIQAIVLFNVDKSKIAFVNSFAHEELTEQIERWSFFVDTVLTIMIGRLGEEDINDYIDDKEKYKVLKREVQTLLKISYKSNSSEFEKLAAILVQG